MSLDPFGALGLATAIALVLVPLTLGRTTGWPAWTWLSIAAAPAAAGMTIWWQRKLIARGSTPVLVLSLFKSRAFIAGLAASAALLAFFAGLMFTLTLLLQSGFGLDAVHAGLVFAPIGLTFGVASLSGRFAVQRYGMRALVAAALVSIAGLASMFAVLLDRSISGLTLTKVGARYAGAAAGTLTTAQQFAGALGVAGIGGVFFAALGTAPSRGAYERAMQEATIVNIALVGVLMLGLLGLAHVHRDPHPTES